MNPFTEPPAMDDARAQRANIIQNAQPLSEREQTALDAALFERTRAERYELAMRRALMHLGRRENLNATLELHCALLETPSTVPLVALSPQHGVNCPKVIHHSRDDYCHSDRDDGPYDVDGVLYCGRCHQAL